MFRSLQEPPKLDGSAQSARPLKDCSTPGCGPRDPAGGIDMGSKWFCAGCWRQHNAKRKK